MPAAPNPMSPALLVMALATWMVVIAILYAWVTVVARLVRGMPLLPRPSPRVVPWGIGSVLAVIVLYLAVNAGVGGVYVAATRGRGSFSPRAQLVILALINAGIVALVPAVLRLTSGARLADFGLGRRPLHRDVVRGVAGCLLMAPIVYAILAALTLIWKPQSHPLEQMLRAAPTGSIALIAFVSGVLLAPAAEELLFRGVLQGWLVRLCTRRDREPAPPDGGIRFLGPDPVAAEPIAAEPIAPWCAIEATDTGNPWTAPRVPVFDPPVVVRPAPTPSAGRLAAVLPNVVTSGLFAALHASQWPAPIPLFLLSLGLGHLYQRTGGVVAPFVMHATFNGLGTALLYLALLSGASPPARSPRPAPAAPVTVTPPATRVATAIAPGCTVPPALAASRIFPGIPLVDKSRRRYPP